MLTKRYSWMARFAALVGTLAASTPAFAQGCAMCYTSASAAKAAAIQALRSGILILLIPPVLIVVAILVRAARSRERFDEAEMDHELDEWLPRTPLEDEGATCSAGVSPAQR